jgi:hypothetical protein
MDAAAAQVQRVDRRLVVRPARDRPHKQELVEHDLSVIEVAFGERIGGFKVKRSERL